jgi:lysophospholipase L1-like esterase
VASWAASIDSVLATVYAPPEFILINLGVNDWYGGMPDKTTWENNYQYIINALHTKWQSIKIYITKPWNRNNDTNATTVAGWIDELIAANSGVLYEADNESVWLKGSDNGATMTTDGTHYSTAGNTEKKNQMMTVLGY